MKKKLLLIELNEFNIDLLKEASTKLKLENISKILMMKNHSTLCDENQEHHGLDPWVQWVSIHTGVSFNKHHIKHLGEVNSLSYPQIWESLSSFGISSGIWGALNASKGPGNGCRFFFPDPWTYSEKAMPKELNNFLALPRYFSKNYLDLYSPRFFYSGLRFIIYFLTSDLLFLLRKDILYIFKSIFTQSPSSNLLFSIFDLVSCRLFLKYQKITKPAFLIFFMNSLAHAQHKYWRKSKFSKELEFTLRNIDRILGIFFKSISQEYALLILNGLTQDNVEGNGYCIYRQINTSSFLKLLGINFKKIEQCMTNDCFVFFNSRSELLKAYHILSNIKINNKKLFHVEKGATDNKKLFYQFSFYDRIEKNAYFYFNKSRYKFFEYFSLLAERTGSHNPKGNIFSFGIQIQKKLKNYELYKYIFNFFKIRSKD